MGHLHPVGLRVLVAEERLNGRRIARQWPGADGPAWYRKWAAISPDVMLDLDYIRQAAGLGLHRTSTDLLADAAMFVGRADDLSLRPPTKRDSEHHHR